MQKKSSSIVVNDLTTGSLLKLQLSIRYWLISESRRGS